MIIAGTQLRPSDLATMREVVAEVTADKIDRPTDYCTGAGCLAQPDGVRVWDGKGQGGTVLVCETCGTPLDDQDAEVSA